MLEITVRFSDGNEQRVTTQAGQILRRILLKNNINPYTKFTSRWHCGGRGICATCGVWVVSGEATPTHWHDLLAATHSYPRLSCQIKVEENLTIDLPNK